MYSRNSSTGKIFLAGVVVVPSTEDWVKYVDWLKLNNKPAETEELTADEAKAINQNTEFDLYMNRKEDGIRRYLMISAEFRLAKLGGDITPEFHILLEDTLKPVRDEMVLGQFKNALRFLEAIGSSVITVVNYDRFHLSLTKSITKTYKEALKQQEKRKI